MNLFKRIQQLNDIWKKIIIYTIIILMAIPFLFFIIKNFQNNLKNLQGTEILNSIVR